jgi:hypothetical protein
MQHERERSAERTRTQKDGHASVTVTAHTYAELDNIAAALDSPDDVGQGPEQTRQRGDDTFGPILAPIAESDSGICRGRPRRNSPLNWDFSWWPGPGSNRRPSAFQADAHTD